MNALARARTLRALTNLLSGGASPAPVPREQWEGLLDLASAQALLPALWVALRDDGAAALPPHDALALIEERIQGERTIPQLVVQRAYEANVRRNAELVEVGTQVLGALGAADIPTLALKGLHGLLIGLWPDPGARVMVDLDVLVPHAHGLDAFEVVRRSGFEELPVPLPAGHRHLPMLGRGEVTVELHTEPLAARHRALLSARDLWAAATPSGSGPGGWRMSDTHAVANLIAHAQLEDTAYHRFALPLRALYDTRVWLHQRGAAIDWAEIARRFDLVGQRPALDAYLFAGRACFGMEPPVGTPHLPSRAWFSLAVVTTCVPQVPASRQYLQRLPDSFTRDRMNEQYGPPAGPLWIWRARLRHVARRLAVRSRGLRPAIRRRAR